MARRDKNQHLRKSRKKERAIDIDHITHHRHQHEQCIFINLTLYWTANRQMESLAPSQS